MQLLNIKELNDGDYVIYEDLDKELKHNSNKCHTDPCLIADCRLPYGTPLKPFTHYIQTATDKIHCFVVKTTDADYKQWSNPKGCSPYGYDNTPQP